MFLISFVRHHSFSSLPQSNYVPFRDMKSIIKADNLEYPCPKLAHSLFIEPYMLGESFRI